MTNHEKPKEELQWLSAATNIIRFTEFLIEDLAKYSSQGQLDEVLFERAGGEYIYMSGNTIRGAFSSFEFLLRESLKEDDDELIQSAARVHSVFMHYKDIVDGMDDSATMMVRRDAVWVYCIAILCMFHRLYADGADKGILSQEEFLHDVFECMWQKFPQKWIDYVDKDKHFFDTVSMVAFLSAEKSKQICA